MLRDSPHTGQVTEARVEMALCIQGDTWKLSYLYWVPFLTFETLLFGLAVTKGIISVRDTQARFTDVFNVKKVAVPTRALKALEVLIRDSVLYFVL